MPKGTPKGKPKRPPSPENEATTPAPGTRFEDLFSEVVQASFTTLSAMSRVLKRPWGSLFIAPDYPAVHDANMAWVERVPKSGISQVLLELDNATRSQGISFRHLEFADPEAAHQVQETLIDMGFTPSRMLAMVRLGVATCIRNPDLEVREVDTPEEWEVFDAIFSELHSESGYSEEVSREIIDRHRARLSKLKERVVMGLFSGEGAGVATLVPRPRLAYVAEVGTRPKFRRRGVGRTLVEEVSNLGQQLGIPYVGLTTAWDNEPARALYSSLGYQAVGERRGFHKA
jgi:ribosomal protein S18 acetylase RimI-like enzyme